MNESKSAKENIKLIYIAFISSFVLLFFASKFCFSEFPNKNNIIELKGILKENIKIKKGRSGRRTLIIKLQKYPKIDFNIGNVSLRQTNEQKLLGDKKSGDSINFFIGNKEYRRKILKTERIPFPENYLHPEQINVVEINNKNFSYLSLEGYNKEHKENNYLAIIFFGFFGLLMFFLGIKGIKHQNRHFKLRT